MKGPFAHGIFAEIDITYTAFGLCYLQFVSKLDFDECLNTERFLTEIAVYLGKKSIWLKMYKQIKSFFFTEDVKMMFEKVCEHAA